jgi:hypothetical protein
MIGWVQLPLPTQAGDKNNVALKSRVLPHDELPLVFPWKLWNLSSLLSSREKDVNRFIACF